MDLVAFKKLVSLPKHWAVVLLAYASIVAATIVRHEPWFDEAQSWLLGRDLTIPKLIGWIRYEGTPPLWQITLWGANRLHLPYTALGWIACIVAVSGMFVFLRFAPFPWPLKLVLPFSYFFLYQYAVIARSYVLLPLLAFTAAAIYKHAAEHPFWFFLVLFLLANVSAHGTLLSAGIAAAHVIECLKRWSSLSELARRHQREAVGLYGLAMLGIVWMVWPPIDGTFRPALPGIEGATKALAGALVEHAGLSAVAVIVSLLWCTHRGAVWSLLIPITLLLVFCAKVYVNVWHYGTITVCLVTALWIAWPVRGSRVEGRTWDFVADGLMATVLGLVLLVQVPSAIATIHYDWKAPYTGAQDAATYLKIAGADHRRVYAYGFSSVAILPYFDRQVFGNQHTPEQTTFWRWNSQNHIDLEFRRVAVDRPDYVVWSVKVPHTVVPDVSPGTQHTFAQLGYSLVHVSPGALFWKNKLWETDSYLIFARDPYITAGAAEPR